MCFRTPPFADRRAEIGTGKLNKDNADPREWWIRMINRPRSEDGRRWSQINRDSTAVNVFVVHLEGIQDVPSLFHKLT